MDDWLVVLLLLALAVSIGASVFLNIRGKGHESESFFWKTMALLAVPAAIGLAALAVFATKKGSATDGVVVPDLEGPDRVGEAESITEALTSAANEEAERLLTEATDDDVASTGAALFDPGADS